MLYFIKEKTIHVYPPIHGCTAVYEKEQLRDTIPRDVSQCPLCMNRWPTGTVST